MKTTLLLILTIGFSACYDEPPNPEGRIEVKAPEYKPYFIGSLGSPLSLTDVAPDLDESECENYGRCMKGPNGEVWVRRWRNNSPSKRVDRCVSFTGTVGNLPRDEKEIRKQCEDMIFGGCNE